MVGDEEDVVAREYLKIEAPSIYCIQTDSGMELAIAVSFVSREDCLNSENSIQC